MNDVKASILMIVLLVLNFGLVAVVVGPSGLAELGDGGAGGTTSNTSLGDTAGTASGTPEGDRIPDAMAGLADLPNGSATPAHPVTPQSYDHVEEIAPGDDGAVAYGGRSAVVQSGAVELLVHHRANAVRSEHDLDPLEFDERLSSVARAHSYDMHERSFFGHEGPDGNTPVDRYRASGPDDCERVGENIAAIWVDHRTNTDYGDGTVINDNAEDLATHAVKAWMHSEGHRENILDSGWRRQGIGVYIVTEGDDRGKVFVTQNFCS